MAYIGNSPANVGNYQIVDDIAATFNGVLTSFALTVSSSSITPAKSGQLLVGINGVMQEPDDTGTNGFKVSSSNIVFSSAPASGDTFWCVFQGQNVDIGTPSDATVGTDQLSATGTASSSTFLRGDNKWEAVPAGLPSQTGHSGKFLTTVVGTNKVFCKEAFSEEERMIYDAMSDFATNELLPLSKNELNKKDEKLIRKLVEQMGELGFLGVDVPEKYGGSEMTKTGMCILAEGISKSGSASFCTVWNVQTSIGSLGIIWYGNDEQKQRWLPGISSGEKITAFGLTEPEAGSDATNSKTTGVLSDDGKHYILNGQKIFISNGAWADLFTIALKIDGKFSSIVVEKGTPGFEIGKEEKKMGMEGSSTVPLYFTDCKVPVENLLGKVGEGAGPAFCALNIGRFKLGASSIGGMMLGIQQAVDYAKQRKAFGQYISDFGSIQEKLATCTVLAYTTDSMCYAVIGNQTDAISELDKDDPEYYIKQGNITERYIAENSIVKIYGSESSGELIDHCLQVFGGYGFIRRHQ